MFTNAHPTNVRALAKAPPALAEYGAIALENGVLILPGQGCRDSRTNLCVGISRGPNGLVYNIVEQSQEFFRNIEQALRGHDLNWGNVVAITIYLKNEADAPTVLQTLSSIIPKQFAESKNRACEIVSVVDLPLDNFVEAQVVASRTVKKTVGKTPSEVCRDYGLQRFPCHNIRPLSWPIRAGSSETIEQQTANILTNLEDALARSRYSFANVVLVSQQLRHKSDFSGMNSAWNEFFATRPKPARTTTFVSHLPEDDLISLQVTISREARVD